MTQYLPKDIGEWMRHQEKRINALERRRPPVMSVDTLIDGSDWLADGFTASLFTASRYGRVVEVKATILGTIPANSNTNIINVGDLPVEWAPIGPSNSWGDVYFNTTLRPGVAIVRSNRSIAITNPNPSNVGSCQFSAIYIAQPAPLP